MKPKLCDDKQGCYHESEKCDGFNDCSDKSDEMYCQNQSECLGNEFITCDGDTKICISRVCDGFNDCEDLSDEGDQCNHKDNIKNISIDIKKDGRILFTWAHQDSTNEFEILIYSV
ncbi:Very low-density lipoprotein receptor [Thelohanellus kitauei]|uniref:Very low-density lipoprotein receptor n=1 Tax=Thelohanellus kitauei TaxID=669202 RepID=A0A0C2IYP9_THEKT|nr:Very low-density lipoprotein receptor [Thelohanellus kitauei]